jgi:AcrR family transcriptional regulator
MQPEMSRHDAGPQRRADAPPAREDELEQYERALPRGGRQLPGGRHHFSREFVANSQRNRILDAMAHAVAERGYDNTAVADVLERAGVSRKTFYEMFADKEECFVATYDTVFGRLMEQGIAAYDAGRRWPESIRAGLGALLSAMAAEPAYARACIVEVLAAGPVAIEHRDAALRAFQTFFDPARPEVPEHHAPPIVAEATVGGIHEVIYRCIVTEGAERLPALHEELTYLALAPFIGQAAAMRAAGLGAQRRRAAATARPPRSRAPRPATPRR